MSPNRYSAATSASVASGIDSAPPIPSFVKPAALRGRQISNISFDNGTHSEQANGANADTAPSITFGRQESLPPLPVPTLEETMNKFLKHLEALETDGDPDDRRATEQAVREFLFDTRTNGPSTTDSCVTGPVLQELLLDYDTNGRKNGTIGSYVEEFWSDAYLAPDASVVLNLNPYFLLEESPDPKLAGNQIRRAASLCFASVKMASQLRNETLAPDTFRGRALCMDQFRALFGASRVPKLRTRDKIQIYEKSNHVAVMCNKQLYYFQALWPDNGDVAVSEEDIANILGAIKAHATGLESNDSSGGSEQGYVHSVEALGVLTSLARNQWAKAREEMIEGSPENAESFMVVDSALFVLVLDDYVPKNKHDAAANMLHGSYELSEWKAEGDACENEYQSGSCTNRWYDKLQIIVTADGGAGINFEHSAIDGHTALRFVSDIYADTVISFAQSITKLVQAHQGLIPSVISATVRRAAEARDNQGRKLLDVSPKKIMFKLSDHIKRKIYFAETALGDQILASDTHILEFTDYGKKFITFNKLSPDSYVQMSMMLAYYRLYGKVVCAYEPVLTKGFYHGRTEAMRPATMEAKKLCEVFSDPSSSKLDKISALRNATMAHSKLVKECAQGKGVDRHLFALKCIAEKNGLPIPQFFRSEAWRKLNHTILSTSNCGNPSLAMFGFGPVVPDGYGIGYIIKDTHLHYAICSKHRQTTRYALTLEGVLREMASLLNPVSDTKVHDNSSNSASKNSLSINIASHASYGDLWGENSIQSSLIDKRPGVIHESRCEKRWSDKAVPAQMDDFLSPPIKMPLKDEVAPADEVTPVDKDAKTTESSRRNSHQRSGSNDFMPVRPDRRSSVHAMNLSKGDLSELMKIPVAKRRPEKLDDYLEETKNDDADPLPSPLVVPLNDELIDNAIKSIAATESVSRDRGQGENRLQRRGSNDLMPVRPNRRSSTRVLGSYDIHDAVHLDDEPQTTMRMVEPQKKMRNMNRDSSAK